MRTNDILIKQVDALESSKAGECIEFDPKQRLTCKENPPYGGNDLWEHEEGGMAPTATGLDRFPVVEEPPQHVHGGIGVKGPAPGSGV